MTPRPITHHPDDTQLMSRDAWEPELGIDPGSLVVASGLCALALDEREGVASWRLDARLYWRNERMDWSMEAEGGSTLWLSVPASVYVESSQQDWLSRVRLTVVALDVRGAEVGRQPLGELWLVWSDGPEAEPRCLDLAARVAEAPVGAWSGSAKAAVAGLVVEPGSVTEVEPPELVGGGAP